MFKIKKNDVVVVKSGDDKGKKGKVLMVFPKSGRAIVEGINLVKKHKRQTRQDQQGGIVSIEAPIAIGLLERRCVENAAAKVRIQPLSKRKQQRNASARGRRAGLESNCPIVH